jgi:hypothetical protein
MFPSSVTVRLPKGSRTIFCLGLFALVSTTAIAQLPPRPVIDPAKELAAIKAASLLDSDPVDSVAVRDVCTACHSSSQFLGTPRSSSRWEQVFGQMAQQGARPTEEQIDRIERYFQRNLIVVNVNTSPDEELGPTLQTTPEVTAAITLRRRLQKFTGIADLATIPGVDRSVLERLKDRLQF